MQSDFPIVVEREGEWFIAHCPAVPDAKGKGRTRKEALACFAVAITPEGGDSSIDEVRAIRHRISAEHGHDPERLVAHYLELQKKYADRLLYPVEEEEAKNGRRIRKRKSPEPRS